MSCSCQRAQPVATSDRHRRKFNVDTDCPSICAASQPVNYRPYHSPNRFTYVHINCGKHWCTLCMTKGRHGTSAFCIIYAKFFIPNILLWRRDGMVPSFDPRSGRLGFVGRRIGGVYEYRRYIIYRGFKYSLAMPKVACHQLFVSLYISHAAAWQRTFPAGDLTL